MRFPGHKTTFLPHLCDKSLLMAHHQWNFIIVFFVFKAGYKFCGLDSWNSYFFVDRVCRCGGDHFPLSVLLSSALLVPVLSSLVWMWDECQASITKPRWLFMQTFDVLNGRVVSSSSINSAVLHYVRYVLAVVSFKTAPWWRNILYDVESIYMFFCWFYFTTILLCRKHCFVWRICTLTIATMLGLLCAGCCTHRQSCGDHLYFA